MINLNSNWPFSISKESIGTYSNQIAISRPSHGIRSGKIITLINVMINNIYVIHIFTLLYTLNLSCECIKYLYIRE